MKSSLCRLGETASIYLQTCSPKIKDAVQVTANIDCENILLLCYDREWSGLKRAQPLEAHVLGILD